MTAVMKLLERVEAHFKTLINTNRSNNGKYEWVLDEPEDEFEPIVLFMIKTTNQVQTLESIAERILAEVKPIRLCRADLMFRINKSLESLLTRQDSGKGHNRIIKISTDHKGTKRILWAKSNGNSYN